MKRSCSECYYCGVARCIKEYTLVLGDKRIKQYMLDNLAVCNLDNELLSDRNSTCNAFTVNPYYMEKLFG